MSTGNVTVFTARNFRGKSRELGIGTHRFFTSADFNDVISSIKVPAGLVAMVYEHADDGGGFGVYVDLLEDRANLSKLGFDNTISFVNVFSATDPRGFIWVRNKIENGEFISGHWERRRAGPPRPPDPVATPGPALPPHPSPNPTVIQLSGTQSTITSLGRHTSIDSARWEHAGAELMGVIGNDYRGVEEIGSAAFERASHNPVIPDNLNFWYPQKQPRDHRQVVYFKRTLAGRMDRVNIADEPGTFKDHDVCIFIRPNARFQYLISDGHPRDYTDLMELQWTLSLGQSGQPSCDDSASVNSFRFIEAEIQPSGDVSFTAATSQLLRDLVAARSNQNICVYGPWIFDKGHCCHGEIHPAEQIWWREVSSPTRTTYTLNVFCDGSGRFWWRNQMDDGTKLKPWGAPPIRGLFAIAFEAELGKGPVVFEVTDLDRFNVASFPGTDQAHTLVHEGAVLVSFLPHTDAFKVSYEGVGFEGNKVRGFLVIETSVGTLTQLKTQIVVETHHGSGIPPTREILEFPMGSDVNAVPQQFESQLFRKTEGHYMFNVVQTRPARSRAATRPRQPVGDVGKGRPRAPLSRK